MSRPAPIPPKARTLHLIGDIQGISTSRKGIMLADMSRRAVPDVAWRATVGDFVAGTGEPASFGPAKDFIAALGAAPWWSCVGNHDMDYQTQAPDRTAEHAAALMGMPGVNFAVDLGPAVLLFTYARAAVVYDPARPYDPSWLDGALTTHATKPCYVIAHPPLANDVDPTNYAPERDAILACLAEHDNAVGWLSGHTHNPIQSPGMVRYVKAGNRRVIQVDASAVHYTIPDINPYDRVVSTYLTLGDDKAELRFRDHGAHQWVGGSGPARRLYELPYDRRTIAA